MTTTDWLRLCTDYIITKLGVNPRDDRGFSAELAVITVLLVGGAIIVVGLIVNAAKNNAANIPDPQAP